MKRNPIDPRTALAGLFGSVALPVGATAETDSTTDQSDPVLRAEGALGNTEDAGFPHPELSNGHRWGQDADEERLPSNTIFEIAKNERRQLVLEYLASQEDPVPLGELAEHIASYENDKPVAAISASERKRVYVGLHQCHIPKMEDAKVVDVDRHEGISLGKHAEEVLEVLAFDGQDTWYRYYGTIALGGGGLVALSLLAGIQPLAAAVLGLYVMVVGGTAFAHARAVR